MKNVIKIILSLLLVVSFNACEDSNNTIDQVVAGTETGGILRTIEVLNNTLNSSIPSTEFAVTIEEQDEQDGGLLKSVDVYVSIKDLTPENGTTVAEAFVKTIDASEFTSGPLGLPRATIRATFGEAQAAMGLTSTMFFPGDLFIFELRLNLTDGRTYGAESATSIISGGFFASPFTYNTLLLCSPQPGDYRVDMHDSYGDGWQTNTGSGGDGIQVDIDGNITEVGLCSPYGGSNIGTFLDVNGGTACTPNDGFDGSAIVTIPEGAEQATWNFPGDRYGEISFEVYGPDNQLLLAVGVGEGVAGLLPITLCLQ